MSNTNGRRLEPAVALQLPPCMAQRDAEFRTGEESADLEVVKLFPLNGEAPAAALARPFTHPHFVRSHFDTPAIDPATHAIEVAGAVANPLRLDAAAVRDLAPARTLAV